MEKAYGRNLQSFREVKKFKKILNLKLLKYTFKKYTCEKCTLETCTLEKHTFKQLWTLTTFGFVWELGRIFWFWGVMVGGGICGFSNHVYNFKY